MSDQQLHLAWAITCYEEWQRCLVRLSESLTEEWAAQSWPELEAAHLAAQLADQALLDCLLDTALENSPDFACYRALVAAVAAQVGALQQRAQTLKALAAAELVELRGGKVAVAGYRPLPALVDSAFRVRG
jgi:hypothetical protein